MRRILRAPFILFCSGVAVTAFVLFHAPASLKGADRTRPTGNKYAAPLQETFWTDTTGNWFTPANWSAGLPNSDVSAQINNGGTAEVMSASAAANQVELGVGIQDTGTLSVSGSGTLDSNSMRIAGNGRGHLSITNGGAVSSGNFIIGASSGSNGTVTVCGSGSIWTNVVVCFVAYQGDATLNIANAAQVSDDSASIGESSGSIGIVTVDGSGSTWSHVTDVTVGGDGTGTLNIINGGSVSAFNSTSGGGVIARNPGSAGTVNLSGAGSTWINHAALAISEGGTAALHVMNGGAVTSFYGTIGTFGGTGVVTVDGTGSIWTNDTQLYVGATDGVGSLTITQGGKVTDATGYIGLEQTSSGTVDVHGAGSTWMNNGNVYVGGNESGAGGNGVLHLSNGGTVHAANVTVWHPGTVSGSGSVQATSGVTIEGTLSPEHTLSINGDIALGTTATTLSTVTPTTADNIVVQGAAALNGDLEVTLTGGDFTVGTQYTLLQAKSGLKATMFANVSISFPPNQGFIPQVTYDTNHVYLILEPSGSPTPTVTPASSPNPRPTSTPRLRPTPAPRPTPPPRVICP